MKSEPRSVWTFGTPFCAGAQNPWFCIVEISSFATVSYLLGSCAPHYRLEEIYYE